MSVSIYRGRSWRYIEREIVHVPAGIPVIVLANHRDMGEHRTVDLETVQYFVKYIDRSVL